MTKKFKDFEGLDFDVDFIEHDISKYDVLFHVTLKERRESIEQNGLLLNQEPRKNVLGHKDLLWFSYPVDMNTGDCFRWNDESCALVILDAKKLKEAGYVFYDDYWGQVDMSSKRNHLMIDKAIPKEFIKKIVTF